MDLSLLFDAKLMKERFNLLPLPLRLLDMLSWILEQWAGDIQVDAYEVDAPTAPFEYLRVAMMGLSSFIHVHWAVHDQVRRFRWEPVQDATPRDHRADELERKLKLSNSALQNLCAAVFRDGGERTREVGLGEAAKEAILLLESEGELYQRHRELQVKFALLQTAASKLLGDGLLDFQQNMKALEAALKGCFPPRKKPATRGPCVEPVQVEITCTCGFSGKVTLPPYGRVSGTVWGTPCQCGTVNVCSLICSGDVDPKSGMEGWSFSLHVAGEASEGELPQAKA